jgi:hypothetical protein
MNKAREGPTLGVHAWSWARFEDRKLVLLAYRPSVPGVARPLSRPIDEARVKGAVQSNVPVFVASKSSDDIASSRDLAIVPYADAKVVVRRESAGNAEITSHYFGGATSQGHVAIESGQLRITARERNPAGMPLEWIEVHIS